MAVQIARVKDCRLLFDASAFGNILDQVGARRVAVIAVSGPLASGKPSIVNRLLKFLNVHNYAREGFRKNLSDQQNEIVMWPEPLLANHNNQSISVLLMSIHGNMDNTITTMENALIFTFGCLLSSVMIYHVKNGMSEDMLQFLQMTISSAKAISLQNGSCPFAKMLFVINDWQSPVDYLYGFHEDHSTPSVMNFKKEKLNVQTGALPENLAVRQEILSSFKEVSCCLAPQFSGWMVKNEGPLQDLGKWIFRTGYSISKTVQGTEVSGTELMGLAQNWAESMVVPKLPAFKTKVEAPNKLLNAVALSVALNFFRWQMTNAIYESCNLTDAHLRDLHSRNKKEAVAAFKRTTIVRQEAAQQSYVDILNAEFDQSREEFRRMNVEKNQQEQPPDSYQVLTIRRRQTKNNCMGCCAIIFVFKIIAFILYMYYKYV